MLIIGGMTLTTKLFQKIEELEQRPCFKELKECLLENKLWVKPP
jgi:hypothetical protein